MTCSDSEDDFICGSSSEDEAAELAEEFYETAVLPNHLPDAESAESENIIPNYSYNWTTEKINPHIFQYNQTAECPVETVNSESNALKFFQIFLNPDIMNIIVEETNRFHKFTTENTDVKLHSRLNNYNPTNVPEMWRFLGLTFLMPRMKKYVNIGVTMLY